MTSALDQKGLYAALLAAANEAREYGLPEPIDAIVEVAIRAYLSTASQAETRRLALEEAARTAYRVCAETRHVTLGDQCSHAIRSLIDQPSTEGGKDG